MAPWWSRPTAEGSEGEPERESEPAPPAQPAPAIPPPPAEPPATAGGPPAALSPPAPNPASAPGSAATPLQRALPSFPAAAPSSPAAAPAEPLDLTGEGEELPEDSEPAGDETPQTSAEPAAPASTERRRRRRNGRSRGSGTSAAAAEARATAEPRAATAEPRAAAAEPARLRPLRDTPAREPRREEPRREEPGGERIHLGVPQLQEMIREIVTAVPERSASSYEERKLAVFCDLENVAIGSRDTGINFDINMVLERLLEKGKIIVKKAYADWTRYGDYKRPFHEAGVELIDIPQRSYSGKNSADIKMVVDAMDLCYAKEHLDTFVLLSGDSDFSPLVGKLKENDKYVIGVGVKGSSSSLLIDSCDEFIYYEDIWRDVERVPQLDALAKKEQEVFGLLIEAIVALTRENKDVLWGSMIKQTMKRKRPSFSEGYYGYSAFSDLLEDAERKNIVKLKKDQRSGSYIVSGFAKRR
ncbi:MAG TPA: NYN domain-containing protein [Thermoanaerobaculia bacterium]|nr:NYN domain-containing protein [Thermoanaerobaculia bacterium]